MRAGSLAAVEVELENASYTGLIQNADRPPHGIALCSGHLDLATSTAGTVQGKEATRSKKLRFVSRNVRVEDITGLFATQLVLVAVLVAASGKETEKPLAIAPRWDVLQPLG